jgi:hypothetical protein
MVVVGVADDSTRHIQEYNSKSKSKKRLPPVKRPVRRPLQMSTHWKPPQQQRGGHSSGGGSRGPGGTPPRPYSRSSAPGGYRGPTRPYNGRGSGPAGLDRLDGGARYGSNMGQGPLREPKGGYGGRPVGGSRMSSGQVAKNFPASGGGGSSSRPSQVKSPPRGQQQQQAARYRTQSFFLC